MFLSPLIIIFILICTIIAIEIAAKVNKDYSTASRHSILVLVVVFNKKKIQNDTIIVINLHLIFSQY